MPIDRRLICLVASTFLLSGCEHAVETARGIDRTWGEANRQTFTAQVINPEPDYAWTALDTSAEHAAKAVERYRTDSVKQPESISTTDVGGGSN